MKVGDALSIAQEHAAEAAATLRLAATISDPYKRADAIWEAVLRLESAGNHLHGPKARACADISRYLQEGCEGKDEPPAGEVLLRYARTLDRI